MANTGLGWVKGLFRNPVMRGLEWDSPGVLARQAEVILAKPFLRKLYLEHYAELARWIPAGTPVVPGQVVELGSGGGFLKDVLPGALTTDVVPAPKVDRVMDACHMDLPDGSVSAFLLLNVFHHIPAPRAFLREVVRTLRPGGRLVMIEPAHTPLWRRLYGAFSPEPYDAGRQEWEFSPESWGPSNLPAAWMVFVRDAEIFRREFPQLAITHTRLHTAFKFLLSGGVWYRALVPGWTYPVFSLAERALSPLMRLIACQLTVVLEKT